MILAWLALLVAPAQAVDPEKFTFVAAGDHFEEPPAGMVEGIAAARPAFVVSAGDLVFRSDPKDFARGSEQHRWLVADLEKTKKKHLFAFVHHPLLSFGGHLGEPAIQREIAPLFEKHRFTAVFTGHSHGYERFKPVRFDLSGAEPRAVEDGKDGVTYVVTASGSARGNLYDIRPHALHASQKKAANYVVLRVDGETVRAETYEPGRAEPFDRFELKSRR
jgi:hypothetical protein